MRAKAGSRSRVVEVPGFYEARKSARKHADWELVSQAGHGAWTDLEVAQMMRFSGMEITSVTLKPGKGKGTEGKEEILKA